MRDVFPHIENHNSDIYIADYTEYSKTHDTSVSGVKILANKPGELEVFHLKNKKGISIDAVNFEENQSVLKDEQGKVVKQCECMCASSGAKNKGWLFLLELKYCLDKNIASNAGNALRQLEKTFLFLRDEKKIINRQCHRVYWIISIPDHSSKAPFDAFVLDQDKKLKYKQDLDVIIFGENAVEVLNEGYLRVTLKG